MQHNVPALLRRGRHSLAAIAKVYFVTEVAGQAAGTIDAKKRDLSRFLSFYMKLYGHDRPDEWYPSVTREFLRELSRQRLSQATRARIYASVRRFARWADAKLSPFPMGLPTDGVKGPKEPEPEWKGLSRPDELRLLAAAQTLRMRPGRGNNQGLRDHALVAVLLGSGLRVTEVLSLDIDQFSGRGFRNVVAKGGDVRKFVAVQPDARAVLQEWLAERGDRKTPIFTTRSGERMDRTQAFKVLQRAARQANAQLPPQERFEASPHVLRHTMLRKLAEQKGVQYAIEQSGHKTDRYIWRYVKPSRESLSDAVDGLS